VFIAGSGAFSNGSRSVLSFGGSSVTENAYYLNGFLAAIRSATWWYQPALWVDRPAETFMGGYRQDTGAPPVV
jgi:hypothetical protein